MENKRLLLHIHVIAENLDLALRVVVLVITAQICFKVHANISL